MSGQLQLYKEPQHQGKQTYTLGSFTITDLEVDVDYRIRALGKGNSQVLGRQIDCVSLWVGTGGVGNLDVNKLWMPCPQSTLLYDNEYSPAKVIPSNCDTQADTLSTRPPDWAIHWRDKYNKMNVGTDPNIPNTNLYSNWYPLSSDNYAVVEPPFEANQYRETNAGKYIYWTLGDAFITLGYGWYFDGVTPRNYADFCFMPASPSYIAYEGKWYYTNVPRENGVEGPAIMSANDLYNYSFRMVKTYEGELGAQNPLIFINFINFTFPIEQEDHSVKDVEMIGVCAWRESIDGIIQEAYITAFDAEFWKGKPEPPHDAPISTVQGGNGSFSAPSDNRGDKNGATAGAIASAWNDNISTFSPGYNNYYLGSPDVAAFREMVTSLWNPNIIEGFKNLMMDPINAIVCCHQVPANLAPSALQTKDWIKAAGVQLTTLDNKVYLYSSQITHFHGGYVDLDPYTDGFDDFTNTSCYIHLPYIGTQLIDIAGCQHGWLAVDYLTDVIHGDCTALITVCDKFGNTEIRYEFKGHCAREVPLKQKIPVSTKVASAIAPAVIGAGVGWAAGSIAAGAYTAGAASALAKASDALGGSAYEMEDFEFMAQNLPTPSGVIGASQLGSVATAATNAALSGQSTASSNASGGAVSSPIDTQIWVLICRPMRSNPALYARQKAYTSDISGKIGDFSGFLKTSTVDVSGIDCTDGERAEIMAFLNSGVFLDDSTGNPT